MIPKYIHQTWRDHNIPEPRRWPESWKLKNPDWEYRLWTDADLLDLVETHYPHLVALYQSYPNPVQRADLGRYMVLHHCGGIYADLDTECLMPLDAIAKETRIILSEEPFEHRKPALQLGMEMLLFNGVMASPKGHPFWDHLFAVLQRCKHGVNYVLESTGPLALSGAYLSYDAPDQIAVHSCHLFNPLSETGAESTAPIYGDYSNLRLSNHYWQGSWYKNTKDSNWVKNTRSLKKALRKFRSDLKSGPKLTLSSLEGRIDQSMLYSPVEMSGDQVAILMPVRDAEPFLDRSFELLARLEYPRDKLRLVLCEGNSTDGTVEKIAALKSQYSDRFAEIELLHFEIDLQLARDKRWHPDIQFARRSKLAKVRNHLLDHGLGDADWALWVDVDVCDYDADVLNRLLREKAKVVTPDCVLEPGGSSYDLNAFTDAGKPKDYGYYKHVKRGLFQPPATYFWRRHLDDLRFMDRVPLTSVGGTMLLVHANVHRAGVNFPDIPYDHLLETEGFGRLCHDLGVMPVGLPNVHIQHVRS